MAWLRLTIVQWSSKSRQPIDSNRRIPPLKSSALSDFSDQPGARPSKPIGSVATLRPKSRGILRDIGVHKNAASALPAASLSAQFRSLQGSLSSAPTKQHEVSDLADLIGIELGCLEGKSGFIP
jgi:hypothetical protein